MSERSILVRLGLNVADFNAGVKSASSSLEGMLKSAGRGEQVAATGMGRLQQSLRYQGAEWQAVGGHIAKTGAAHATFVAAVGATGVAYNQLQQTSRAALTTLLGGTRAANEQMDKLDEFARTSPFAKSTFIEAQQQMLAFGIEAENVVPYLDAIQNAVAAAGGNDASLRGIVEIMAKIQSSAKITAMDLNQFGNWGVDAAGLIGSAMGKTGAQIREEITAGTLDAGVALDALAQGMQTKFGGAAAGVKETMAGAFDRVKAAWRDLSSELMEPLVGTSGGGLLVDLTNQVADLMRGFQKLPGPVKDFSFGMAAASGGLQLALGGVILLGPKLLELQTSLTTLGSAGVPVISKMAAGMAGFGPGMQAAIASASSGFAQFRTEVQMASITGQSQLTGLRVGGAAALQGLGGAAKNAGSAILGALGGGPMLAVTAGIAGVTTAIAYFARKAQEAKQNAKEFADTLDEVSGKGTKLSRDWAFDELIDGAGLQAVKDFGFNLKDIGDSAEALDSAAIREMADSIGMVGIATAGGRLQADFYRIADAIDAASFNAGELAEANADAADSNEEFADATEGATEAIAEQTNALIELMNMTKEHANSVLSLRGAQSKWQETLEKANATIAENGANLDLSTEAGRANQAALDDIASAGVGLAGSMANAVDETGRLIYSSSDVQASMQETRDQFTQAAIQAGYSADEAANLADKLGLIPGNYTANIYAEDYASGTVDSLIRTLNGIDGKTVRVYTEHIQIGRVGHGGAGMTASGNAMGGAIIGAGTGTSDSIPRLLSNGEHVLTAAEVNSVGGQQAVYAMRAMMRSGYAKQALGLANGGAVGYQSGFVPNVNVNSPPVAVSLSGAEISGTLAFDKRGMVQLIDGRIVKYQ